MLFRQAAEAECKRDFVNESKLSGVLPEAYGVSWQFDTSMNMYAHQQAKPEQQCKHRRPAI